MEYGKNFHDYYLAKKAFFLAENKRRPWILLGILTQIVLVFTGCLVIPVTHLFVWSIAVLVSSLLIISGLMSIWWKKRKFTSFERWLKHRERSKPNGARRVPNKHLKKRCSRGR
jgi:hypothetical protein